MKKALRVANPQRVRSAQHTPTGRECAFPPAQMGFGGYKPTQIVWAFCVVKRGDKVASRKNPVGAPPKYRSVKAMQEKIDAYFEACKGKPLLDDNGESMRNKNGYIIYDDKKPPTVTGLALALGFASRQALLNYQNKPEFNDTITRAKTRCEQYAEERLYDKDGSGGAQFSLRANFGWQDKPEQQQNSEVLIIDDL